MNKYAVVLSIAGVAVLVDQITKWYIRQHFALYESLRVIDSFFQITYARNAGGAFGLLNQGARAWRLPFFLIASCVAVVVFALILIATATVWINHWREVRAELASHSAGEVSVGKPQDEQLREPENEGEDRQPDA